MLIVPIEDIQAGMVLAADLVHPSQPEQVLLRRGYALDGAVIGKLREMGVIAVYVDYPSLAEVDRHLIPAMSPERIRIYSQVKATIGAVLKTVKPTVGFTDYYCAMHDFVIALFRQGDHPIYLEQIASRLGDQAVCHATAVAHLSLLLGIRLHSYLLEERKRLDPQHASEVVNLGIAGMLHDIGKCKLSPETARYCATEEPEEAELRAAWESHAELGFKMVHNGIEPSASVAILHHHQAFDGTGFPKVTRKGKTAALSGHEIHVFARIVRAADLFDRLTHRSDGSDATLRRPAFVVLHELRSTYGGGIDPVVMGVLAQVVPPFPPGGRVGLSDGTEAVVTGLTKDPYRPVVRRCGADRWTLREESVDLTKEGAVAIAFADGVPVEGFMPATVKDAAAAG